MAVSGNRTLCHLCLMIARHPLPLRRFDTFAAFFGLTQEAVYRR